jgi:hypothetical protein
MTALHVLCAAVMVLSPEFVRKKFTMRELKIFLERKVKDPSSIIIIPVLYELAVEQCCNLEQLYDSEPWPSSPKVPKVEDKEVLKEWAADVKKLLEYTGVKIEEVRETVPPGAHASTRFDVYILIMYILNHLAREVAPLEV